MSAAGDWPSRLTLRMHVPVAWCLTAAVLFFAGRPHSCPADEPETNAAPRGFTEHFVPTDQLDAVLQRHSEGVLLPRAEFTELLRLAAENGARDATPVDIATGSVKYLVTPGDSFAEIEVILETEQFTDEMQTLNVPAQNLYLIDATTDEAPSMVGRSETDGHSSFVLFSRNKGTHILRLKFLASVRRVGSDRTTAFRVPPGVPVTVGAVVPAGSGLVVNGRRLGRTPGEDQVEFPAGNSAEVRIHWAAESEEDSQTSLVFVRSEIASLFSSETLRWKSDSTVSVFGNRISELSARVPAELEITAVESAGIESWVLEDDPDQSGATRVRIRWRQPFSGDRLIQIRGVTAIRSGAGRRMPTLEFPATTAHTGRLVVGHEDQLRLDAEVGNGIRRSADGSSTLSAFDFWLPDYELTVAVRPRDRELFTLSAGTLNVTDRLLTYQQQVTVETLHAPLFDLSVRMPEDWEVLPPTAADDQIRNWRSDEADQRLHIDLKKPVPPGGLVTVTLNLQKAIADPADVQTIRLPFASLTDVVPTGGTYSIVGPADLALALSDLSGMEIGPSDTTKQVLSLVGTEYSGTLRVERKPARLTARSEVRSWLDLKTQTVSADVTVDITGGTIRELQFDVPEEAGNDLRFNLSSVTEIPGLAVNGVNDASQQMLICAVPLPTALQIAEQTVSEPRDGRRIVTLVFDQRASGSLTFRMQYTVPRSASEDEDTSAERLMKLSPVILPGAIRQHGFIVAEAFPEQQLSPTAGFDSPNISTADAALVQPPDTGSNRRVARVYRFTSPQFELALAEQRFATTTVPVAVCEELKNIAVVDEPGRLQRSVRARLRLAGVPTIRFRMPDTDQDSLWSTMLDGEPVEVRRDEGAFLVAVPPSTGEVPMELELLFTSASQLPVQLMLTADNNAAPIPIEVLSQTWEVRHPPTLTVLDHSAAYRPAGRVISHGILRNLFSRWRLPEDFQAVRGSLPAVGLVVLVLAVIGRLCVNRRWVMLAGLVAVSGTLFLIFQSLRLGAGFGQITDLRMDTGDYQRSAEPAALPAPDDRRGGWLFDADYEAPESSTAERSLDSPFGAGGFGGGMGAPAAAANDLAGGQVFSESSPGFLPPTAEAKAVFESGQTPAVPQVGQQGGGQQGSQQTETLGAGISVLPPTEAFGDEFSGESVQGLRGKARLSVRTRPADPPDFKRITFRSIASDAAAADPGIVVESVRRQSARCGIAAGAVLLIALLLSRRSVKLRLSFILVTVLLAVAAVPLLSNRWQTVADGILVGSAAAVVCWVGFASCRLAGRLADYLRGRGKQPAAPGASAAALIIFGFACEALHAAPGPQTDHLPSADAVAPPASPQELVVVPYDPDRPALTADEVFVPGDQFLRLYQAAHPEALKPRSAARAAMVTAAYFRSDPADADGEGVATSGSLMSWTGRFVIHSFSENAETVVLPIGAVHIVSAKSGDSPVSLIPVTTPASGAAQQQQQQQQAEIRPVSPAGSVAALITAPGLHLVDIEFQVQSEGDRKAGSVKLPLRSVPAGSVTLQLPSEGVSVEVDGRSETVTAADGSVLIPLSTQDDMHIRWRPMSEARTDAVLLHAESTQLLSVTDAGLSFSADLKVKCRQGEFTELRVRISEDYAVQSVDGVNLAGWDAEDGLLRLRFRAPVTTETQVAIRLFQQRRVETERTEFNLPLLQLPDATRDSGTIAVAAVQGIETRSAGVSGVTQTNLSDTAWPSGADQNLKPQLSWRYTRHPAEVSISVFRTADRVTARNRHGVSLERQQQRWTSLFEISVEGSARRHFEVEIPDGLVVTNVDASGPSDWYTDDAEPDTRKRVLNVQLDEPRTGVVVIVTEGYRGRSESQPETLDVPFLRDTAESTSDLSIWLDSGSETASFEADGWTSLPISAVDPQVRTLSSRIPEVSLRCRTEEDARPATVELQLRPAISAAMCESVLVTNATDTSLELTLGLNWQISRAATSELAIELPNQLASVLDFAGVGLQQIEKTDAGEDRTRVLLRFQQPVSGQVFVIGIGAVPLPDDRILRPFSTEFTEVSESSKISGQSHFWLLVNQSEGLLQPGQQAAAEEEISRDQLRTQLPDELVRQSVALRRLSEDRPVGTWELLFPEQQATSPAVIVLAAHTVVLAEDGSWRSLHSLKVRNESRQFLPARVPAGSRFLMSRVNGRPTRIVSQDSEDGDVLHLLPIPPGGSLAAPFDVDFVLSGRFSSEETDFMKSGRSGNVQIPLPEFPQFSDDPRMGVSVSRHTLKVIVPDDWRVRLNDDPRLTNMTKADASAVTEALLMCSVDNLRWAISSVNAAKSVTSRTRAVRNLRQQQQIVQSVENSGRRNNDSLQALQEAERVLSDSEDVVRADDYGAMNDPFGTTNRGGQTREYDVGGVTEGTAQFGKGAANEFLQEEASELNRVILDNTLGLLQSNSGAAVAGRVDVPTGPGAGGAKGIRFRFALPREPADKQEGGEPQETTEQLQKAIRSVDDLTDLSLRDGGRSDRSGLQPQSRQPAQKGKAASGRPRRSQLLEQRYAPDSAVTAPMTDGSAPAEQRPGAAGPTPSPEAVQRFSVGEQAANVQLDASRMDGLDTSAGEPRAAGLLSLQFGIPQNGVSYDYVRAAGNAGITLNITDSRSMQLRTGLLWAAAVVVALIALLRAVMKSGLSLVLTASVIVAATGLAVLLCGPQGSRTAGAITFVAAAVLFTGAVVARSFARQPAA